MNKRRLFARVVASTILTAPFLLSAGEWAGGGFASAAAKKQKALATRSSPIAITHDDISPGVAATRLGAPEAETSRTQLLWAGALSRSLGDRWSVVAELSGTHRGGVDDTRQLLVATSLNVSRRFVVDAGGARSLRYGAPVWSAFTGFTWLAARLF